VASPGEGLNEFGYVTGAIEDRVIHLANLAGQAPGLATHAVRFSTGCESTGLCVTLVFITRFVTEFGRYND
jgi:hypothetical protein